MALGMYRQKRNFKRTPEPRGKARRSAKKLSFVVQEHHASRLHFDFRLEHEGVLVSWAIPKGPTLNPAEKRLAVKVEDHPLEYRTFKGVIPEGNYGAGRVYIWDSGTYEMVGEPTPPDSDRTLGIGLKKGKMSFVLFGKKLRGAFALARLPRAGKNTWLFIKKRDSFADDRFQLQLEGKPRTRQLHRS